MMDYFIKLIKKKHKVDVSKDNRALQKLRREAERAKRALSSQHQVRRSGAAPLFLVLLRAPCRRPPPCKTATGPPLGSASCMMCPLSRGSDQLTCDLRGRRSEGATSCWPYSRGLQCSAHCVYCLW